MTSLLDIMSSTQPESRVRNGRRVKLSDAEVLAIAGLIQLGRRQYDIAVEFGVSESLVCRIAQGERWASVTGFPRKKAA